MDCYIFTGGDKVNKNALTYFPSEKDFIIAADSGAEMLCESFPEIVPDIVLGDFDSSNLDELKKHFTKSDFYVLPREKDDTDTFYAIKTAIEKSPEKIVIVGGLGSRADHGLANIFSLIYIKNHNIKGYIDNGDNLIYLAENTGMHFYKSLCNKTYISLIPLTDVKGLNISGFKYDVCNKDVLRSEIYTTSNELSSEHGVISFREGEALIIETN